jgi:N-acetylmuramoyl-L-alanine amidase
MATIYKTGSKGEVVRQIQRALHVYPDGVFGQLTREAVIAYQRENGLTADGLVGPATLAKLLAVRAGDKLGLKRSRRNITEIIVHCTATAEGRYTTVDEIRRWHRSQGWSDIGYHYVVYLDGTIHEGRNVDVAGAHCTNHNARSIGVVYVGGCARDGKTPKDTRTEEQKASLLSLLMNLRVLYPKAKIHGHCDFANKACPSFDATHEYMKI